MGRYREALQIMCQRCYNHEICQGSGCEPKKRLELLVEEAEKIEELTDKMRNDRNLFGK